MRIFTSVFMKEYWCLGFPVMSLCGFGMRVMLASKLIRNYSFCSYLLEEIEENLYNFLLKYLVEFTSELIWAWFFLFWKVVNHSISFKKRLSDPLFFLVCVLADCLGRNWSISFGLSNFGACSVPNILSLSFYCPRAHPVVLSPIWLLRLVICVFSFFLSLARALLVLLIFSKNWSWLPITILWISAVFNYLFFLLSLEKEE